MIFATLSQFTVVTNVCAFFAGKRTCFELEEFVCGTFYINYWEAFTDRNTFFLPDMAAVQLLLPSIKKCWNRPN